jgi:tetratricopeptide (TPR) repeat protein
VDALNYIAKAYLQLNEVEKAIGAYEESIRLDPTRDDVHVSLGNLYFSMARYLEAKRQYESAVRLNSTGNNHFALGQAYLSTNRLSEAQGQLNPPRGKPRGIFTVRFVDFLTIRSLTPEQATGNALAYSVQ